MSAHEAISIRIVRKRGSNTAYETKEDRLKGLTRANARARLRGFRGNHGPSDPHTKMQDLDIDPVLRIAYDNDSSVDRCICDIELDDRFVSFHPSDPVHATTYSIGGVDTQFYRIISSDETYVELEIFCNRIRAAQTAIGNGDHYMPGVPIHFNFYNKSLGISSDLIGHRDQAKPFNEDIGPDRDFTHGGFHPEVNAGMVGPSGP